MIAELLERRHLRAHGNDLSENLDLGRPVLDLASARAFRLEPDKQHQVLGVRQPLQEMVLYAASHGHAIRGDDDARITRIVDLLRFGHGDREMEAVPEKRRSVALNQFAGFVAELLRVLEKNFDRLDRHRRVCIDRHPWNLPVFHEILQQEQKLLGSLDRERRHHDAASALDRVADKLRHPRPGIVVRVRPVAVSRLHHQHVGRLALRRSGMHHLAGRSLAVAHPSDIAGKQTDPLLPVRGERHLRHRRPEDVRRAHQTEADFRAELHALAELYGRELRQRRPRLLQGVERQGRIVFGRFLLIVERRVFFLQVAGIGKQDAA